MERLTDVYKGRYGIKTPEGIMPAYEMTSGNKTMESTRDFQKGIDRLADYENTGLMPEQIIEMDRLYAEKRREVARCREALLSAGENEWIPVERQLPEANVDVLVSVQEIGGSFGGAIGIDCLLNENGDLVWGTYYKAQERVIAWMPLPMKYQSRFKRKTMGGAKVAYSFDNECYSGSYDTVEEAMKDALEELKLIEKNHPEDMPESVYIGECEFFKPSLSGSSWDIIDAIQCQAEDEGYGEYAVGYLDVSKEKYKELESSLEKTFQEWLKRHRLHPDLYKVNSYGVYKYDADEKELKILSQDGRTVCGKGDAE